MSAFVLAALALLGNDTRAVAAPPLDLSGRWVLNEEKSEDAREKMREGRGGMRRPEGGGRGGPGGGGMDRPGGGMGGGRGGRRPPPDGAGGGDDRRSAMRAALEATPEMTITHTAREIAILEKDGRLRALHPDGEKYADSPGAEVKARWDKDRLVVSTSHGRGPTITESWRMTAEPAQPVVEMRFQSPNSGDVTVKRVYDRAARK